MGTPRSRGLAAVITACVLWGASFYFGKVALSELPPDQVVLCRFVLALIVLVPLVALRALPRSRRSGGAAARPLPEDGSAAARPAPEDGGAAARPAPEDGVAARPAPEDGGAVPRRRPNGVSTSRHQGDGDIHALLRRPLREDWAWFGLNALLMVPVQFVLQFEGLARTTASSAALIVGAFAPMLAVAAAVFANERMGRLGWGAVACSTVGLVVMVGAPGEGRTLLGDLMVLASLLAAVGMVLTSQRLVRRYDSLVVTVLGMGMGTALLLPYSVFTSGWPAFELSAGVWMALLGLGIGCTALTFSLWNWGIRVIPASHAGVYVNLEPVIGAILGIALLGETVEWELVVGGMLILTSAVIISWPKRAERRLRGSALPAAAADGHVFEQSAAGGS